MSNGIAIDIELNDVSADVLGEPTRRLQDIDTSYRVVAEKMGQFHVCADANRTAALTRNLHKPMRNASDNEQMFAAILDSIKMQAIHRK
jgi:hypothetical protein